MAKNIKKNYFFNLIYQILTMITPIITTPYLSRVLGADGVGTDSYIQSVSSYFVLFATMGLTTFGQREISYAQDDKEKRTIVFWETNILELFFTSICILAYIIFSLFQNNRELYLILSINLLTVIANITWFFQGLEEFGIIVSRNLIIKILNVVFIFLFIKDRGDLIWYMLGTALFSLLGNISLWPYVRKYIGRISIKLLHPFRHMKVVLSLFIPTVAIQIYTVMDKTMIGVITKDSHENGYYEQAIKLSKMVMAIITSLGTVMRPRIGYHYEKGETDEVRRLMYRGYKFVWFLGTPLCLGLIMVSTNFVPWFFGDEFAQVALLLKVLPWLILAIGINNVTGMQYLIPTKRQNLFTLSVCVGASVNFIMNIVMIRIYGALGAAIASVSAETVIAVFQLIIIRKELNGWIIVKSGINYFVSGIIMCIPLFFLTKGLNASVINTFLIVFVGASVYFLCLFAVKDEFLMSNISRIVDRFRKK